MTERERFEAEYRKRSDRDDDDVEESLRLGKDGEYIYDGTWTAFYWWQAARAKSPQVPEGMALVPVKASAEITFEIRGEKIVFCKDGVYFALTKEQTTAMHAAMLAATKEKCG